MKVLVMTALVAAVLAAPSPQAPPVGAPVWPIRPYSYSYDVSDPLTNNFQNKAEIKTATGDVFGSYSVLMPDNYIYTTTYNVTGNSGYVARLIKTLAQFTSAPAVGAVNPAGGGAAAAAGVF